MGKYIELRKKERNWKETKKWLLFKGDERGEEEEKERERNVGDGM